MLNIILCRFGPRFPAMTTAYDRELRRFAKQVAFDLGMDSFIREGVYVHLSGPNYETPSESIFLRNIGADAVGMSTAPEVTVARHADIRVLGKSSLCAATFLHQCSPQHTHTHKACRLVQLYLSKISLWRTLHGYILYFF